ncbi:hypothetical protein [Arthrobacter sp. NPDC090010]|uniref:hypothetical protein n=1 Tax=Arthrobacter sp. NPDC090010 TaxID=3363942 RepID=UPI00382F6539
MPEISQSPSTALEDLGARWSTITADLEDLFTMRRALFDHGYALGVAPRDLSDAAGVSGTFLRSDLGAAPISGSGSTAEKLDLLENLLTVAKRITALQADKAAVREQIDQEVARRVAGGDNCTTATLAQESQLSTATIDRIRKELKSS